MTASPPTPGDKPAHPRPPLRARIGTALADAALGLLLRLPYHWRIPLAGWLAQNTTGRMPRHRARIRKAVLRVFPDLPETEIARLCARVPNNMARTAIEVFSGAEFARIAAASPIGGPGLDALDQAHAAQRPVILATAHFGNYDAARAVLLARGFRVGGYYKPLSGPALNRRYVAAIESIGTPLFADGRQGMAQMLRFLRTGGMVGFLFDLDRHDGPPLDLLGKPARTTLSAAEMALRYDALLVPIYVLRQPDGLQFRVVVDSPIAPDEPRAMTQKLNDSLGKMIAAHKDQWLWWHKRWRRDQP